MKFYELVKQNRSCRGFDPSRPVTWSEMTELVDCARLTPSAANRQPLRYDLVWEKEEVSHVQALTRWAAALPERHLPDPGKEAAAFIVILQETEWVKEAAPCQRDVGIAAQTILLAATEKGLGGLMIGNFDRTALTQLRGYPDHLVPQLVIALGKPAEKIVLTQVKEDGSTTYYRDEQDIHYVPKRGLDDILWGDGIRREKSCGAVVYKMENGTLLFLLEYMVQGHISLPKGHMEGAETEEETALREIREETNLQVDLNTAFRYTITYAPGPKCLKDVVFFLAEAKGGEMRQQESEVSSLKWMPYPQALEALTYGTDREILQAAYAYLT